MAPRKNLKSLNQLVPDLRAGLQLSLELTARNTTMELKQRGPYWSGDFEASWVVEPGQVAITADRTTDYLQEDPSPRQITPVTVPVDDTDSLRGYTIGNRMEYREIAMDLQPGDDGRIRGDRTRATAPKDWFTSFMLGGESWRVIGNSLKQGMGLAGFK